MDQLNPRRTALALGSFVAFWHLVWVILLGLGWAKPLMDLNLRLHHIVINYDVAPFSWGNAIGLIVFVFIIAYLFGWVFAVGWNKCKKH